jgi:hypothetical protein
MKNDNKKFISPPVAIQRKISRLGRWLDDENGLGLNKLISSILKPLEEKISDEEIAKYTYGAKILLDNGNINENKYNWFTKTLLPNVGLIYVNNEWHPVNKLNTNPKDLANLLTDFLFKSYNSGGLASKKILENISDTSVDEIIKNSLLEYKDRLKELFELYLEEPEDLFRYVENNIKDSFNGEKVEDEVKRKFESLGYELLYQGGNGDYLDMVFSVDLIFKRNNGVIKTIQVKSSEYQLSSFIKKYEQGKHRAVDLVIYPSEDSDGNEIFTIYDVKLKTKNKIKK